MSYAHRGGCHCGAIGLDLRTSRAPQAQIIGACQCAFCRKHNARTFSDPAAACMLEVRDARWLRRYRFGLRTAEAIVCGRCGVYVAMLLCEGADAWSTINIDALEDRALFSGGAAPRDYSTEEAGDRVARRKARWIPTELVGWPA